MRRTKILQSLIFLVILAAGLNLSQNILTHKMVYPSTWDYQMPGLLEYQKLRKNSVQVLFAGTSHVQYGVIPMQLYDDDRIVSYNIGLSAQHMSTIYYHLLHAFETQRPEAVLLDVSALFQDDFNDTAWRHVLDNGFRLSAHKIEAAVQYADEYSRNQEELYREFVQGAQETDGQTVASPRFEWFNAFISALFPLYTFHDRWSSLKETDFNRSLYRYDGKGYTLTTRITKASGDLDHVNKVAEEMSSPHHETEVLVINGNKTKISGEAEMYEDRISEEQRTWLDKIAALCDEHQVRLSLIKIPVWHGVRGYPSAWTRSKSEKVREIADEMGVSFLDIAYDTAIELDADTDFRDNGMHLNYLGALKATACLGEYITDVLKIEGKADESYEESLAAYRKIDRVARLAMETDCDAYFQKLSEQIMGKSVYVAAKGGNKKRLVAKVKPGLNKLGLAQGLKMVQRAYIGISENGASQYEAVSYLPLTVKYPSEEECTAEIASISNKNTSLDISKASIIIDGEEYSFNWDGYNIVVYDHETQKVIDSVCIQDGGDGGEPVFHRNMNADYSQQYMFDIWTAEQ